jgi:hypothetical protein
MGDSGAARGVLVGGLSTVEGQARVTRAAGKASGDKLSSNAEPIGLRVNKNQTVDVFVRHSGTGRVRRVRLTRQQAVTTLSALRSGNAVTIQSNDKRVRGSFTISPKNAEGGRSAIGERFATVLSHGVKMAQRKQSGAFGRGGRKGFENASRLNKRVNPKLSAALQSSQPARVEKKREAARGEARKVAKAQRKASSRKRSTSNLKNQGG